MNKKYYPIIVGIIVVICIFFFCCWFNYHTTFLIVRHAEKLDGSSNTNLSTEGLNRAASLVDAARDSGVSAIYSTNYCRTAQTAQPLASTMNLPINVQGRNSSNDRLSSCLPDISVTLNNLAIQIDTTQELTGHILSENAGDVILVVGHSNTVPGIVEQLGANSLCPEYFPLVNNECRIPEDEFYHLFVVTKYRFFTNVRLIKAKYGN